MNIMPKQFDGSGGGSASMKQRVRALLRSAESGFEQSMLPLRAAAGRLRYLSPRSRRFTGAYPSYEEAFAAASRAGRLAGYNHHEIAEVSFEQMCRIMPWDYPVMFWLNRLHNQIDGLLDAGGHMGTKYRAFRTPLALSEDFRWVIYELPAIAEAGRRRAEDDGLRALRFVDDLKDVPQLPVFLGSGLLQYLDVPLSSLLTRLPALPRHLLLNKVALRKDGPPVVTLERIGDAYVPYQMRNEAYLLRDLDSIGYRLVDRWSIDALSHVIDTHPELGPSSSAGFYFRLEAQN